VGEKAYILYMRYLIRWQRGVLRPVKGNRRSSFQKILVEAHPRHHISRGWFFSKVGVIEAARLERGPMGSEEVK
jgi:hypothetical protein